MRHWNDGGGTWWWAMGVMMIAFWAVVAWAVVTLVQRGDSGRHRAEDVLAERYARGEIDEREFKERRELIRK